MAKKRYEIVYERNKCIGAGTCVEIYPKNWKLLDDGKAKPMTLEFDENEFKQNKDAADSCPVNAIHIVDRKTGKRLI